MRYLCGRLLWAIVVLVAFTLLLLLVFHLFSTPAALFMCHECNV